MIKMKKYVKIIVIAAAVVSVAVSVTFAVVTARRNSDLRTRTAHQQTIIDSLLARRMTVLDMHLSVTDKSKSTIYGKGNSGSIVMPQEKKYILEIDTSKIEVRKTAGG